MRLVRFIVLTGLLALACTALSPRGAFAVPLVTIAPTTGDVVAGETVELRWSRLPGDIQEVELLLSLDGGRTYGVRISPQLDPRDGRYLWRVPNLPASNARLRLRVGSAHDERFTEPSAPFRIVGTAGGTSTQRFHENGWWGGLDDGLASTAGALSAGGELASHDGRAWSAGLPQRDEIEAGRSLAQASIIAEAPRSSRGSTCRPCAGPRSFPRRN